MQGTNRIYEEPSRLSQGLVVGLSIAVLLMAGWLAATITLSPTVEGAADATAQAPDDGATASLPTTLRQPVRSNSVHFDWPAEFASSTATQPATPPPAQTALPLAPEVPPARDVGRAPWPAAPDARDRSISSRPAAEATDAIVDILAPPAPPRGTTAALPPRPAQAPRRQKPRVVETEPAAQ